MRSDNMPRPFAPSFGEAVEHSEPDIVARLRGLWKNHTTTEDVRCANEAADEIERLRSQNAGLLDQHSRDSKELSSLCKERDEARATAMYWQAAHTDVFVGLSRLRERLERAPIVVYGRDCSCLSPSGGMHEPLIGKRVRLVPDDA